MEGNQRNVGTKVERKVMEKNRRNQMKLLYSKLSSLLPTHQPNELPLTVADQLEEAIKYIKSLQTKVKREEKKKEGLFMRRKGSSSSSYTERTSEGDGRKNSPQLKIREMGSAVEVVLTNGLDDQFIFYEIIHIFHEERAEIINASYSVLGSTVFYTLHAEIEDVVYEFGATKLTERLKRLVYESTRDAEMQAPVSSRNPTTSTTSDHHLYNHEI